MIINDEDNIDSLLKLTYKTFKIFSDWGLVFRGLQCIGSSLTLILLCREISDKKNSHQKKSSLIGYIILDFEFFMEQEFSFKRCFRRSICVRYFHSRVTIICWLLIYLNWLYHSQYYFYNFKYLQLLFFVKQQENHLEGRMSKHYTCTVRQSVL